MVRKDRNTKNTKCLEKEEDSDYTDDDTKINHEEYKQEDRKLSIIYDTQQQLIKYINDNGLPLGQYLTQNYIENFIYQLTN